MKYFLCSDLHSYYTPFIKSLVKAKWDVNNPEHKLVILGDVFDRGNETLKIYDFIQSIPKDRRVLIRGNHELLFLDLLKKSFPSEYDFSNGTVSTFCQIANINEEKLTSSYWFTRCIDKVDDGIFDVIKKNINDTWKKIKTKVKKSKIYKWLISDEWVYYYEFDRFVCTHSFIPLTYDNDDWHNASNEDWEKATWCCPYEQFFSGAFRDEIKQGKTLVCGHWHSFDFKQKLEGKNYITIKNADFSIFYSKYLIALDTCTALSKKVNVMIVENGVCYNKNGTPLKQHRLLKKYRDLVKEFEK